MFSYTEMDSSSHRVCFVFFFVLFFVINDPCDCGCTNGRPGGPFWELELELSGGKGGGAGRGAGPFSLGQRPERRFVESSPTKERQHGEIGKKEEEEKPNKKKRNKTKQKGREQKKRKRKTTEPHTDTKWNERPTSCLRVLLKIVADGGRLKKHDGRRRQSVGIRWESDFLGVSLKKKRKFPGFTEFLQRFTGFYLVLPSFTGFYWVLLGFTWFNLVLPGFT